MGTELREQLDAAWESDDDDDGSTFAPASEVIEAEDVSDDQEDSEHEAETQFAKGEDEPIGVQDKEAAPAGAEEPGGDSDTGGGAPLGWSPEARENWGGLPDAAKAQIVEREQQMEQMMAHTSQARQESQILGQISNKYATVMAAEGAPNVFAAVDGMFQTATRLRMGTPQEKAGQIANLIKNYGVDIETLDNLLVGQAPPERPTQQFEQMLDQRMAPVNQMMQQLGQMQQNKQYQQQDDASNEVQQFAGQAEFLNDVRNDMADLMDLATKRGQPMSLEDAYNKACAVHPQVSQVLAQRQAQESLVGKRNASSSIRGSGQEGSSGKNLSVGDEIRQAWDAFS